MRYIFKPEDLIKSQNQRIEDARNRAPGSGSFSQDLDEPRFIMSSDGASKYQVYRDVIEGGVKLNGSEPAIDNNLQLLSNTSTIKRGETNIESAMSAHKIPQDAQEVLYKVWTQNPIMFATQLVRAVFPNPDGNLMLKSDADHFLDYSEKTKQFTVTSHLKNIEIIYAPTNRSSGSRICIPGEIKANFKITNQGVELVSVNASNNLLAKCLLSKEMNITPADLRYAQAEEMFNTAVADLQACSKNLNVGSKNFIEDIVADLNTAAKNYFESDRTSNQTDNFINAVSASLELAQVVPSSIEQLKAVRAAAENVRFVPAVVAVDKAVKKMEQFGEDLQARNQTGDGAVAKTCAGFIKQKTDDFFKQPNKTLASVREFEVAAKQSLNKASESLDKHHRWKDVLVAMTVVGGIAMLFKKAVTGSASFFTTASARTVQDAQKDVSKSMRSIKLPEPTPSFGPSGSGRR